MTPLHMARRAGTPPPVHRRSIAPTDASFDAQGTRGQTRRVSAPLDDLRVVEASGPIGHYAGKLLADLGADVIKVEPPEGEEEEGSA